jgi:hypothetical protein
MPKENLSNKLVGAVSVISFITYAISSDRTAKLARVKPSVRSHFSALIMVIIET